MLCCSRGRRYADTLYAFYAFNAFCAWWFHFPQSGALTERCSHTLWGSDLRGWRALSSGVLTVAPCACCVNLYVCMYNVRILQVFPYFYHCITSLVFSCLFCFCFLINFTTLKVHHCQHLASMTKHDTGGSPPGAACDSTKPKASRTNQPRAQRQRPQLRQAATQPSCHMCPRRPHQCICTQS